MDELKAVRLAIQMEKKAAQFYNEAARQTKDTQAKKILGKFSEDEESHARLLQTLVDNYYVKHSRFDIPDLTATEYQVNREGPIYSKGLKELAEHPEPVVAAVARFALAESEAIKLYRKLAGESNDHSLKKFFKKLAEWEEKHLTMLKRQAASFKKTVNQ